jgi:cytochrome b561
MKIGERWSLSVRFLHWLGAAAILFMLAFGFVMVNLIDDPGRRFDLYQAHKSLGLLILILMIARIGLRLAHAAPTPIATIPLWQRRAAASAHVLLYALTIALIIAGYAMVSASPLPLPVALPFGFKAPNLLAPDFALSERFKQVHHVLAAILALCVALHVAAALKHQFIDRNGTLRRMGLF